MMDAVDDNHHHGQILATPEQSGYPCGPTMRSVDIIEPDKSRSRLRVTAILLALAVRNTGVPAARNICKLMITILR